ncbi:MAG: hypothetical protein OXF02_02125 [Simkaniaceae bacterium]|nr:hypothetical protein [Simkaniaceae bacterium]
MSCVCCCPTRQEPTTRENILEEAPITVAPSSCFVADRALREDVNCLRFANIFDDELRAEDEAKMSRKRGALKNVRESVAMMVALKIASVVSPH